MSLLYAPATSDSELLARLHVHAVLPAFESLLQCSQEARAILKDRQFSLAMRAGNLVSNLFFNSGECCHQRVTEESPSVVLHFLSYRQLNSQFTGRGVSLPLPLRGAWRIGDIRTFMALSDCLKTTLLPDRKVLAHADSAFVACHLQLSFSVALAAATILLEYEPFSQRLFAEQGDWMVSLRVDGSRIAGWIRSEAGQLSFGRGLPQAQADAELVFQDSIIALQALGGELDNFAGVNGQAIRVGGLAPLAEKLGLVLDRVPAYLDA